MSLHVSDEVAAVCKRFITLITLVRFLAGVRALVASQAERIAERLTAKTTCKRSLAGMSPRMILELPFRLKRFVTFRTYFDVNVI